MNDLIWARVKPYREIILCVIILHFVYWSVTAALYFWFHTALRLEATQLKAVMLQYGTVDIIG